MIGQQTRILILLIFIFGCLLTSTVICKAAGEEITSDPAIFKSDPDPLYSSDQEILSLNDSLKSALTRQDLNRGRILTEKILGIIRGGDLNDSTMAESYYYVGLYYHYIARYFEAVRYLYESVSLKEKTKQYDGMLDKGYYNLGVEYNRIGDIKKHEEFTQKSLNFEIKLYGDSSPKLIDSYSSLISACIQLKEYKRALSYLNEALGIVDANPGQVGFNTLADLYSNYGVVYARLADYSKARVYFDKAEQISNAHNINKDENYINLLNNLAVTYGNLHLSEISSQYYEKGILLARTLNAFSSYNFVNSYAIILAKEGNVDRGEKILKDAIARAEKNLGTDSRIYNYVISYYADYEIEYMHDYVSALKVYNKCMDYLKTNGDDLTLKTSVYSGYALCLAHNGEAPEAIKLIQGLLYSQVIDLKPDEQFDNPPPEYIKPDKNSLSLLRTKYHILSDMYAESSDQDILIAAANTAELIVSVLERVRINISEDESRILLGDRYRSIYLNAIANFNLLYDITGNSNYLNKTFEYCEKSKVAGLLTSTRELKAVRVQIPSDVAEYEQNLQQYISLYNALINQENAKDKPDSSLLGELNDHLLENTRLRDSLIQVFEHKYPEYYAVKYDTRTAEIKDIPSVFGRNGNYINYVLSDSVLYIFIANREKQRILAISTDTLFLNKIRRFRELLKMPSPSDNALEKYREYQSVGLDLYRYLIEPVKQYLISDKIIISPDNMLSYIPFEAIPVSADSSSRADYRDMHYLMDDYDISYTYSATFKKEMGVRHMSLTNKVLAFAPVYMEPINIQSVLSSRQSVNGILQDLPYARQEAEFVTKLTGGKLYENANATETEFKEQAGKFDIIHLAMHTLINDRDPMNSKLIFSLGKDTLDDDYLNTYEVYSIPLKAKMVVLSSCNTGNGKLYTGEGILSLARGFIYSGSKSVVMS
ncbi:MAG TPA: CHAT domain-containing tetratricopeptide repeat protein, partial [Bacteroidales bacterium]|nr:CHAT domain-containing tetratricopeptide repeat protein [Bacteroidales bacterium]